MTALENQAVVRLLSVDTKGEVLAMCSGTLVASGWVLSAVHCLLDGTRTLIEFRGEGDFLVDVRAVEQVIVHPQFDFALLQLDHEVDGIPPIAPAPDISPDLGGGLVQISGFGVGERLFAVEEVVAVSDQTFVVSAAGYGGACLGDSGGPALARSVFGTLQVIGVLSFGSTSCRGEDIYLRTDVVYPWFMAHLPSIERTSDDCGAVTATGQCMGSLAVWCDGNELTAERCEAPAECAWDEWNSGYRCNAAFGNCENFDSFGECVGGDAIRCVEGRKIRNACSACDASCVRSPLSGEVTCAL